MLAGRALCRGLRPCPRLPARPWPTAVALLKDGQLRTCFASACAEADPMSDLDLDDLYAAAAEALPPSGFIVPRTARSTQPADATGVPPRAQQPIKTTTTSASAASRPRPGPVVAAAGPPPVPTLVTPGVPLTDLAVFKCAAVLVDKPLGWTSFDVCNALKGALRHSGVSKVGHAGTLDPNASGLLIVCTGTATKAIEGYTAASKCYAGSLRLGESTPSQDGDTPVDTTAPWEHISDADLAAAAGRLTGDILQVPPMYSAVHHQGRRLYELAREGTQVERAGRPIHVSRFQVSRDGSDPRCVDFEVECSKGTYVRTLCADLGQGLGSAAYMTRLVRTASGEQRLEDAWQVQPLLDAIWSLVRQQVASDPRSGRPLPPTFTYTPRLAAKREREAAASSGGSEPEDGLSRRARRKQKRQELEAKQQQQQQQQSEEQHPQQPQAEQQQAEQQ